MAFKPPILFLRFFINIALNPGGIGDNLEKCFGNEQQPKEDLHHEFLEAK
jgi:hypothetical protein